MLSGHVNSRVCWRVMSRTVILSAETVAHLVEAHASMAAWYYELGRALREGGAPRTPDEATRKSFLARVASDFPELATVARAIDAPRLYIPPPAAVAPVATSTGGSANAPGGETE
jgi:hypothetical protein